MATSSDIGTSVWWCVVVSSDESEREHRTADIMEHQAIYSPEYKTDVWGQAEQADLETRKCCDLRIRGSLEDYLGTEVVVTVTVTGFDHSM
jgi:hypothetical protein